VKLFVGLRLIVSPLLLLSPKKERPNRTILRFVLEKGKPFYCILVHVAAAPFFISFFCNYLVRLQSSEPPSNFFFCILTFFLKNIIQELRYKSYKLQQELRYKCLNLSSVCSNNHPSIDLQVSTCVEQHYGVCL
jgi:hypothetical protein